MANRSNAQKEAHLYFTCFDRQSVVDRLSPEGVQVTYFSWLDGGANGGALLPLSVLKVMDLFADRQEFEVAAKGIWESVVVLEGQQ